MGKVRGIVGGVIIAALLAFLFYPTFRWLLLSWLNSPYYSHGFLVPLISLFFLWRKRGALFEGRGGSNKWGWLVVSLGLAGHLVAMIWQAYYLSALVFILLLFGLVIHFCGLLVAREVLFPLAFLLFMVPFPMMDRLSPYLESLTATCATNLVRLLGIPAQNLGSQIYLPDTTFVVAAPCSGLNSLVSLLALAALFAFLVRGTLVAKLALLGAAVPIALAANLFRVSSLFSIAHLFGAQAGMTYFHNFSSPILFLLAFALLIGVGRVVGCSEVRQDI